jgi:hypothetical protein
MTSIEPGWIQLDAELAQLLEVRPPLRDLFVLG